MNWFNIFNDKMPNNALNGFNIANHSEKCQILTRQMSWRMLRVEKISMPTEETMVAFHTWMVRSFSKASFFLIDGLLCKQSMRHLLWNILKFCTQPLPVISWHYVKFVILKCQQKPCYCPSLGHLVLRTPLIWLHKF